MSEKKKSGGALLGAAFLMATSAIGPGFLTQTATFTGQYQESFGFVILVSVILAATLSASSVPSVSTSFRTPLDS